MISTFTQPFSVVLIEDDEGHANLINRNLQRAGVLNPITRLRDGHEALTYFFGSDAHTQPLDRTVVVLDLNLPDIDGFEILRPPQDRRDHAAHSGHRPDHHRQSARYRSLLRARLQRLHDQAGGL